MTINVKTECNTNVKIRVSAGKKRNTRGLRSLAWGVKGADKMESRPLLAHYCKMEHAQKGDEEEGREMVVGIHGGWRERTVEK